MKRLLYAVVLLLTILVISGCSKSIPPHDSHDKVSGNSSRKEDSANSNTNHTKEKRKIKEDSRVDRILKSMTLEEKIGQVFIAAFRYNSSNEPMLELDEEVRGIIKKYKLGGVILFSENIDTIPQTVKLIKEIQRSSRIPLFIAIDEEGGLVSRLNSSSKMHATKLPGNAAIGKIKEPQLAYEVGKILGREVGSLGFNINFAPVADVNTNPDNPVIGERAFGSDPENVAQMVEAMVRGVQDQNVSTVLKHFPGHGDTLLDTHTGEVIIKHNRERLEKIEFVPFKRGIKAGADGIMTAHIKAPHLTKSDMPATLSKEILTGILRKDMKYKGLIITDALEMGAINKYWNSAEAAVKAFEAGADIILIPASIEEAYCGLLDAVKQGDIPESRLNESVRRILNTKHKRKILDQKKKKLDPEKVLGCPQHQEIADIIYKKMTKKY